MIEAAYKRLARKYHPDVSHEPGTVEKMVRINQAWEMLRDPIRRAAVDRARARAAGTSARVAAARRPPARRRAGARRRRLRPPSGPPAPGRPRPPARRRGRSRAWSTPRRARSTPAPSGTRPTGRRAGPRADRRLRTRSMGIGSAGRRRATRRASIVSFGRYDGLDAGRDRAHGPRVPRVARPDADRPHLPGARSTSCCARRAGGSSAVDPDELRGKGMFRRR